MQILGLPPGLYLGDGVEFLENCPPDSLDGIFTDPPWGAGPDIVGQDRWLELTLRVAKAAQRVVRPDGHIMLWFSVAQLDTVVRAILSETQLIWNISLFVDYVPKRFVANYATHDLVFVFGRKRFSPPRGNNRAFPMYVSLSSPNSPDASLAKRHSCARNQQTVAQILKDWWRPGDVICDPFAGTDTTGWAARRLGIACYSFEADPEKYALALERHSQMDLFLDYPNSSSLLIKSAESVNLLSGGDADAAGRLRGRRS